MDCKETIKKAMEEGKCKDKYNVSLRDDGTLDTVVEVNGREIRYDQEFGSQFRNRFTGAITDKGWKELKRQAIKDYEDDSEW